MARYAVLATIDAYPNAGFPPLSFAGRDGEALEQILIERGQFRTVRFAGANATRERILDALAGKQDITQWPAFTSEDLLLFFFAGHGELVGGSYVLHAYQARAGTSTYSIALRDVEDILKRQIPCRQCACIVDACRSLARPGARGAAALDAQSARDIKAVASTDHDSKLVEMLYGCDEGQVSMEDPTLGHGVLTYHIATVMRESQCTTLEDLFDEAADRMRIWSRGRGAGILQEPQLYRPGGRHRVMLFPQKTTEQPQAPVQQALHTAPTPQISKLSDADLEARIRSDIEKARQKRRESFETAMVVIFGLLVGTTLAIIWFNQCTETGLYGWVQRMLAIVLGLLSGFIPGVFIGATIAKIITKLVP